ncbi:hypothetical protein [Kamptonema formosum]|uniref:hypothetical protein n=1 Tax=Kamptonema formosum TaxID=331992 RepID=UPI00035CA76B|nr:hypothetical protein [Oscillatoria sp. PCC 10802]
MPRFEPFTLQMQITRMFAEGQSFFAPIKVQDWLRERNQEPANYEIVFHQKPAPPGSGRVIDIEIELRRKDGQPVDPWLQEEVNRHA